ncbi:hypothetical protein EJB05_32146, partial [Eragrostis curvula]
MDFSNMESKGESESGVLTRRLSSGTELDAHGRRRPGLDAPATRVAGVCRRKPKTDRREEAGLGRRNRRRRRPPTAASGSLARVGLGKMLPFDGGDLAVHDRSD